MRTSKILTVAVLFGVLALVSPGPGGLGPNLSWAVAKPVGQSEETTIKEVRALLAQLDSLNKSTGNLTRDMKVLNEQRAVPKNDKAVGATGTPVFIRSEVAAPSAVPSPTPGKEKAAVPSPKPVQTADTVVSPKPVKNKTTMVPPRSDYWNSDIRKQTIEEIQSHQQIDKLFKEAKKIPAPGSRPSAVSPEEKPQVMTPAEILHGLIKTEYRSKTIDLIFDETTLGDIAMLLSDAAHINIVLDPLIKSNKLDLHLKSIAVEEALLLLANSYDLGFKRVGESLYITKLEKLRVQNQTSHVFKLKNIKASEVKVMLKDLIDTINVSDEINSLTVVGQPEDIIKVEKIINKIDRPQPQVILEAKIIEVNKDALKDLGVDWSKQINIQYQESGRPVDLANIEDAPGSPIEIMAMARNPIQFSSVIKMLENQNKAKVLSNPRVSTLNDKEAEIFVGDRIPYTVTSITGGVATTDVRFEEPGIRLTITPSIIEDDFVVIKVEPEVSFIFTFRGPNDQYPWVKKRHAVAYVRVKNNQPFVLGGLLNEEDKRNLYKVPLIGNLPLVGNLFSWEKKSVLDTELIITVTPTIVYDNL